MTTEVAEAVADNEAEQAIAAATAPVTRGRGRPPARPHPAATLVPARRARARNATPTRAASPDDVFLSFHEGNTPSTQQTTTTSLTWHRTSSA